jgi:hypothetical protein
MAEHLGLAPILVLGVPCRERIGAAGIDEATCRRPKGHDGEHSAMARTGAAPTHRRRREPVHARLFCPPLLPEGA